MALSLVACASVLAFEGYEVPLEGRPSLIVIGVWLMAVAVSAAWEIVRLRGVATGVTDALRRRAVDFGLLALIILIVILRQRQALGLVVFVRQALVAVRVALQTARGRHWASRLLARPAKLIAASFLALIAIGTLFLTFPRATVDGRGATWMDAAFTATSASCVTGLSVMNTRDDAASNPDLPSFSPFGQLVILALIQVGGLGIMTLSAAVVLLMGQRLGAQSQKLLQEVMEETSRIGLEKNIRFIVTMTFVIEGLGATVLFFRFLPEVPDPGTAAVYAIFTSVSAYCNAGFSLWSDSLTAFKSDWVVMGTIMGLVTVGGIGFVVVQGVTRSGLLKRGPWVAWQGFSAQVKMVLSVSVTLTLTGALIFFYFDFHHSLSGLDRGDKLMASLFQSVTFRTAGFNTVDFAQMSRVTLIAVLVLMFIGGSSGSTAGGVKTSTVAVVLLSVRAMLLGRDDVEAAQRTIPKTVVYKSISILVIFVGLFLMGLFALLWTEPDLPFEALVFESMSALATVGVSMGITPDLSPYGKLIVTFLMFVGRIGPLTLALAVGERQHRVALRYPEERIMVG